MSNKGSYESGRKTPFRIVAGRPYQWLVPVIYAVSAVAFVLDLFRDNSLAYGIIYTPLIATAVFHRSRSGLWILSGVACLMVVIGACAPVVDSDLPDMIGNRSPVDLCDQRDGVLRTPCA